MAINKSLLNNSDSIENIQQSLNSFGASLRAANNTSSIVIRKFYDANRKKKEATTKMINLSMRRREAVRRREQESIIESGKVGGILRRTSKVIGDSTKGLLGRIMDFVGTILVGWVVTNLPIIINSAEDLIGRMQKAGGILTGWFEGTVGFFNSFTSELGSILSRITGFDFDREKTNADKDTKKIEAASRDVTRDFNASMQLLSDFNLEKDLGIGLTNTENNGNIDPNPENPPPSNQQSRGKNQWWDFLDIIPNQGENETQSAQVPSGGKYNVDRLTQLAKQAGIPEKEIPTMVAIAMAESGGDSGAHNTTYPDNSYGLWQINMLDEPGYMLGAERRKQFGLKSNEELFDPVKNAKAAYAIYKQQGFGAWSVYTSGRYKDFLPAAKKAQASPAPATTLKRVSQPVTTDLSRTFGRKEDVSNLLGASATVTSLRGDFESFRSRPHGGVDIACAPGLYISLTVDAMVVGTGGPGGGYGNVIDVWIPSLGVQLRFAHNTKILISSGEIPAGTSFATTGYTGNVKPKGPGGSHIHLEASTQRGSTNYGGNTSPNKYISIIRLSRAKISRSSNGTGGPSLTISGDVSDSIGSTGQQNRGMVASNVTPEKKSKVAMVPMPMPSEGTKRTPLASGGGQSIDAPAEGMSLNTVISRIHLNNLANT